MHPSRTHAQHSASARTRPSPRSLHATEQQVEAEREAYGGNDDDGGDDGDDGADANDSDHPGDVYAAHDAALNRRHHADDGSAFVSKALPAWS
eukprot:5269953-Pleurochrysis_carterae.AAC.3